MAVINRDFDVTEQIKDLAVLLSTAVGASAGTSYQVAHLPYPATLRGVFIAANSISGAPVVSVDIKRWTSGGVTTIPYASTTLAVLAYGASAAYQGVSLAASGSTLLNLQAGDVIVLNQQFSGGNVAIGGAVVTTCVQAIQDIRAHFNITT